MPFDLRRSVANQRSSEKTVHKFDRLNPSIYLMKRGPKENNANKTLRRLARLGPRKTLRSEKGPTCYPEQTHDFAVGVCQYRTPNLLLQWVL